MKAVVYSHYGSPDVLELKEVEKPIIRENEVLVKVYAASLNAADWHLLRADPFVARFFIGLLKPRYNILGADIAGRVKAVGRDVKQFKPGDEVFGELSQCGWGGFAEYARANEDALALKPSNLTFEEAAAAPLAALTALQALRDIGHIQAGQKVLVNGASGGVGTFAVQLAKVFGAEVTAVCSTGKISMVRSIGADHVVDYTYDDFTKKGQRYDLIIGANGYHSVTEYERALSPGGIYVMTGGSGKQMFEALFMGPMISMIGSKKIRSMSMKSNKADLLSIKELLEAGKVVPVIDRRYPLSEIGQAIRYLEEGHAKGKIIVTI